MREGRVSYEAEMLTREQVVEIVRLAVRDATVHVEIYPAAYLGNAWTIHLDGLSTGALTEVAGVTA